MEESKFILRFEETKYASLESDWAAKRTSLERECENCWFPENATLIILDYRDDAKPERDRIIDLFSRYMPGRFFYYRIYPPGTPKEDLKGPQFGIARHCLSNGKELCSLACSAEAIANDLRSAVSVMLRHSLVGFPSQLLVLGSTPCWEEIRPFVDHGCRVFFDFDEWRSHPAFLDVLLNLESDLVDIEWLQLSDWRAQFRNLFSRVDLSSDLSNLSEVEIFYVSPSAALGLPSKGLLLGGWFLDRLNFPPSSAMAKGIECTRPDGSPFRLLFTRKAEYEIPALREAKLTFTEDGTGSPDESAHAEPHCKSVSVRLLGGGEFDTVIDRDHDSFHFSGVSQGFDLLNDLDRFFRIGESLQNYRGSLLLSLQIDQLERGFRGNDIQESVGLHGTNY